MTSTWTRSSIFQDPTAGWPPSSTCTQFCSSAQNSPVTTRLSEKERNVDESDAPTGSYAISIRRKLAHAAVLPFSYRDPKARPAIAVSRIEKIPVPGMIEDAWILDHFGIPPLGRDVDAG